MPSPEYTKLEQAIADVKADLLNFDRSPTEPYSTESLLKCQAFVVFSHAEMQVYFEAVARKALQLAEQRWNANQVLDRVTGGLIAFRRPENVSVPNDPRTPHALGDLSKIIESSIRLQNQVIAENNGIKRWNISQLFTPLGLLPADLNEKLLIQLDQTGERRGDMVHKSSRVSIRRIREPFDDEAYDIDELIKEIKLFDEKLIQSGAI